MERVVDVVTRYVLEERQPAVAMMWLSEPDVSQHSHGVGSPEALNAIREADGQFGRLLDWLEQAGRATETDIIVVSDHGYSTITEVVDVEAELRRAGFPPGGEPGGVTVAPNGGAVLFYRHRQHPGHFRKTGAVANAPTLERPATGVRCGRGN